MIFQEFIVQTGHLKHLLIKFMRKLEWVADDSQFNFFARRMQARSNHLNLVLWSDFPKSQAFLAQSHIDAESIEFHFS